MSRYLAVLVVAAAVRCGPATPAPSPSGALTVFAAASLTESFDALAADFSRENGAVTVRRSYGSSSTLVAQIVNGAQADIFASADEANMDKLLGAGLSASQPRIFATNSLAIVVRAGDPKHITQLADLARPDVVVVLAAPSVPVGAYGQQAFDKAGVKVTPKSLETDVKQVVAKVALGEADAGIVYGTDVKAGGAKIEGVAIPDRFNVVARYPISVVRGAPSEAAARSFVEFVVSARGREILASFGFGAP